MYTADNGHQAIAEIQKHQKDFFTAVLLDLNMPIMDGFEACDRINNLLNREELNLPDELLILPRDTVKSRTLLFCLSADVSHETSQMIALHPFDGTLTSLNPEELQKLKSLIAKHNPSIAYSVLRESKQDYRNSKELVY